MGRFGKMMEKFNHMMTVITFAEANDSQTALQMLSQADAEKKKQRLAKARKARVEDNRPRLHA